MIFFDSIDVNADVGEGFPNDAALLGRATSASVACGAHAGDALAMRRALIAARDRGVRVGAHPGYADREGFGRREADLDAEAVERLVREQVAALLRIAGEEEVAVRYLKPHGALYNQAQRGGEAGVGVVAAAASLGLPLFGQPGTALESLARSSGVAYVAEGFPDRRYRADGSLTPRTEPDAVITDPAELQENVRRLTTAGGRVQTLCIHGDHPHAVADADLLITTLHRLKVAARPFIARTT